MNKKFSLRSKLLSLCLFLSTVSAFVGLTSYVGTAKLNHSYEKVTDVAFPKLRHLNNMFLYFRDIRISLRTLGLADLDPQEAKKYINSANELIKLYEAEAARYLETDIGPEEKLLYQSTEKAWSEFKTLGINLLDFYEKGDSTAVKKIILSDCPEYAERFTKAINELKEFQGKESVRFVDQAEELSNSMNILIVILIITGVIIGISVGTFFANNISAKFKDITKNLIESSSEVSSASSELSTTSNLLSENSTSSASSLQETVASLEQLTAMVKQNSEHAKEANILSQESLKSAEAGKEETNHLIEAMQEMSASSKKIEEIINVIDDIAFQTNLLALNAAVEAARAGEHGKGFAVVAEAVRSLAQRSAEAAKNINQIINENVLKSTENSKIAYRSGEALLNIVKSVEKVATLNLEIASASQEQSAGLQQISIAMNQLDTVTQSNVNTAKNVESFAIKMSNQSDDLIQVADKLCELVYAEKKISA